MESEAAERARDAVTVKEDDQKRARLDGAVSEPEEGRDEGNGQVLRRCFCTKGRARELEACRCMKIAFSLL